MNRRHRSVFFLQGVIGSSGCRSSSHQPSCPESSACGLGSQSPESARRQPTVLLRICTRSSPPRNSISWSLKAPSFRKPSTWLRAPGAHQSRMGRAGVGLRSAGLRGLPPSVEPPGARSYHFSNCLTRSCRMALFELSPMAASVIFLSAISCIFSFSSRSRYSLSSLRAFS